MSQSQEPRPIVGKMIDDLEIRDLVDLCLTDRASPEQWKTLSELIVNRPDVSEYYAAQAIVGARLAMVSRLDEAQEREVLDHLESKDEFKDLTPTADSRLFSLRRVAVATFALAASAMIFLGSPLIVQMFQEASKSGPIAGKDSGPVPPALVLNGVPGETTPTPYFGRQMIELPEGTFDGVTSSGVKVQIVGPARIRVEDPMLWRMFHGKVLAKVSPLGHGFTIRTHQADVVDLGTEFGVAISGKNLTEVVVYEGSVSVSSGSMTHKMSKGEAITIPIYGERQEVAMIDRDGFLQPADVPASVISEVRFNNGSEVKDYKIVKGGFTEDALAYVDRVHRWKGIDAGGLPSYMVDLDYVQMPNDLKFTEDWKRRNNVKATFVFNSPAVVYLLYDERLSIPSWLPQKFTDTGVLVGLDKGSHEDARTSTKYQLDQEEGPGKSVDVSLRVWRAILRDGGELEIGPLGSSHRDWVVPTVVARPI
ncbi:FecR domain-containing protein [Bremerella sp. JC817]|uniref:FecR domain-containing protein n=1 Tax=Bremerella sp. JC817 TaxID=3231756 RepID=UPI003459DF77